MKTALVKRKEIYELHYHLLTQNKDKRIYIYIYIYLNENDFIKAQTNY